MKVLITGASGFLGRRVVDAFLAKGIEVRAMVRPATKVERFGWPDSVEIVRHDLRARGNLVDAFDGIDTLVHLAACVGGDDDERFASTVVGSERLLDAMANSATQRIVLASTFSVYDWSRIEDTLDETSPLESDLYTRDSYAVTKAWQERMVQRMSEENEWDLRILRPGFIWGAGNSDISGIGQRMGGLSLVFGDRERRMPLTHVDNCADCFVTVTLEDGLANQIFNVVDDEGVSAWRYDREYLVRTGRKARQIPVPYAIAYGITRLAERVSKWLFNGKGKLPSILIPCRFEARFKPLRYSNRKLAEQIGWTPPLSYEECLDRTFASDQTPPLGSG
jgi:nucleoside-diphosphate-sugar epimerase